MPESVSFFLTVYLIPTGVGARVGTSVFWGVAVTTTMVGVRGVRVRCGSFEPPATLGGGKRLKNKSSAPTRITMPIAPSTSQGEKRDSSLMCPGTRCTIRSMRHGSVGLPRIGRFGLRRSAIEALQLSSEKSWDQAGMGDRRL